MKLRLTFVLAAVALVAATAGSATAGAHRGHGQAADRAVHRAEVRAIRRAANRAANQAARRAANLAAARVHHAAARAAHRAAVRAAHHAAARAAHHAADGAAGRLYAFGGELLSTPGANATSISAQVENGNRPALRALIGAGQNQVFAVGAGTRVTVWSHGVPHVGTTADLQQGDFVTIRVRAPGGSTLQTIESAAAAAVVEHAAPNGGRPLWLFVGTVAGPQSGGHIALHVDSGNWKALHAMLGQSLDQSFTYDDGTIFLLWQSGVPTVISPSQLEAGDRITIRIRSPRDSSLAQVEATPAAHVGDHEPAPPAEE